jgi:hypothetical protein
LKINRKIRKNGALFFSAILILTLLLVPSMSCKSEPVTTTLTVTEKSTVTSTVVSTVNNTVTNTTTVTSTVTNTPTTQTSTSKTTTPTTTKTSTSSTTTPTTSTTLAYTTGTTSAAWNADGIITEGEYAQMQQMDDNYYVYWNTDDEYIYVGVKVKTQGWIGFGVNFNIMAGSEYYIYADMVFGQFVNGEGKVYDGYAYASSTFGADSLFKANDDLVASGITRDSEYTTMEFKRALNTGDDVYDCVYKPGESNYVVWCYASTDKMLAWAVGGNGAMITMTL